MKYRGNGMLKKLKQLLFAHRCICNGNSHYKTVDCYYCPYANVIKDGEDIVGCDKKKFNEDLKSILTLLVEVFEKLDII